MMQLTCAHGDPLLRSRLADAYVDAMVERRTLIAGIAWVLLAASVQAQKHTVAITVDDLPLTSGIRVPQKADEVQRAEEANRTLLHAFARHNVPVTGLSLSKVPRTWVFPQAGRFLSSGLDLDWISGTIFTLIRT